MRPVNSQGTSIRGFLLVLGGLSLPLWTVGAIFRVQIFPGLYLFQLPLAMPSVAAMILVAKREGPDGVVALLRRTYDFSKIKPKIWYLAILLVLPSIGFINYLSLRLSGAPVPPLNFSLAALAAYCPVFLMTYTEEIGLTGYATDRLQQDYSALTTGIIVGAIWAGYHIPGFVISGYYTADWILWHAIYTVAVRVLFVWIYNNSGKSLFAMALCHWMFGLFWILLPATGNLQKASPFYDPQICAGTAIFYVIIVVAFWTPRTLSEFRISG